MNTARTTLRTLALVAATALPVGAVAGTASAHDELTGTTPSNGSTVTSAPATVRLTFAEKPLTVGNQISVKGPDGSTTTATPTVSGTEVTAPLSGHGNGLYTVTWRVVSDDGHPVSGTYTFTVKGASSSSSSAAASQSAPASSASSPTSTSTFGASSPSAASKAHTTGDSSTAWGVIGGVAALAVVVVAAVAFASRRRRG